MDANQITDNEPDEKGDVSAMFHSEDTMDIPNAAKFLAGLMIDFKKPRDE